MEQLIHYFAKQKKAQIISSQQFTQLLAWSISYFLENQINNRIIEALEQKLSHSLLKN